MFIKNKTSVKNTDVNFLYSVVSFFYALDNELITRGNYQSISKQLCFYPFAFFTTTCDNKTLYLPFVIRGIDSDISVELFIGLYLLNLLGVFSSLFWLKYNTI